MSSLEKRTTAWWDLKGPWQPRTYRIRIECVDKGNEKVLFDDTQKVHVHEVSDLFRKWWAELAEIAQEVVTPWIFELHYKAREGAEHDR